MAAPTRPADTVYKQLPAISYSKAAFILGVSVFKFEIRRALAVVNGVVGGKTASEVRFAG